MKDIVIFDLDGTLALIEHRRHFVQDLGRNCPDCSGRNRTNCVSCMDLGVNDFKPDWHAFHAACVNDKPNNPIIKILESLQLDFDIWIVSGRSDEVEDQTTDWLFKYDVPFQQLIMRKRGDYTPDDVLKKKWLDDGTIPKERVTMVFDDRQRVVDMWRREGLTCLQVAPGDF